MLINLFAYVNLNVFPDLYSWYNIGASAYMVGCGQCTSVERARKRQPQSSKVLSCDDSVDFIFHWFLVLCNFSVPERKSCLHLHRKR